MPSLEVILNGSGVHTVGLVALHTTALPPGPFVVVKISGCAATMVTAPRNTVPLLLIAMGKTPDGSARGTTNWIWVELTEKRPHAAPLIETETAFNSIGSDGARFASEALVLLTVALGTGPKSACTKASSPAARPVGLVVGLTEGLGDGLGLGLGVGLMVGLGVAVGLATGTLIKLAPVKSVIALADSALIAGDTS